MIQNLQSAGLGYYVKDTKHKFGKDDMKFVVSHVVDVLCYLNAFQGKNQVFKTSKSNTYLSALIYLF